MPLGIRIREPNHRLPLTLPLIPTRLPRSLTRPLPSLLLLHLNNHPQLLQRTHLLLLLPRLLHFIDRTRTRIPTPTAIFTRTPTPTTLAGISTTTITSANTLPKPPQLNNPPLLFLTQPRKRSHIFVPFPHARGVPVAALDFAVGGVAEAWVFGGPVGGVVICAGEMGMLVAYYYVCCLIRGVMLEVARAGAGGGC